MPLKRKRNASLPPKGLLPGERLKRPVIHAASASTTPWGWVGTEVTDPAKITLEHRLAACNLSRRNKNTICANKYSSVPETTRIPIPSEPVTVNGEIEEDIIVISDDDEAPNFCSKKTCRTNPNCLNNVGQDAWEDGTYSSSLWHNLLDQWKKQGTPRKNSWNSQT